MEKQELHANLDRMVEEARAEAQAAVTAADEAVATLEQLQAAQEAATGTVVIDPSIEVQIGDPEQPPPPLIKPGKRGKRADQALDLVSLEPEITASEIAARLDIKPNYLYRVMNGLVEQGAVIKNGRKYRIA